MSGLKTVLSNIVFNGELVVDSLTNCIATSYPHFLVVESGIIESVKHPGPLKKT